MIEPQNCLSLRRGKCVLAICAVIAVSLLLLFAGCGRDNELSVKRVDGGYRMVYIPSSETTILPYVDEDENIVEFDFLVHGSELTREGVDGLDFSYVSVPQDCLLTQDGSPLAIEEIEAGDFFDVYLERKRIEDDVAPNSEVAKKIVFVGHGGEDAVEQYGWILAQYTTLYE